MTAGRRDSKAFYDAQTVTVYGANFVSGATVEFGGASSPSVVFISSAELSATTPAHAQGLVDVTVTNPDQQSDTLFSAYTYIDYSGIPDVRLHYYHNDHLGTPLFLTDAYGTVVWEGLYKPFGDMYYENTDPDGDGANVYQPFRFPGQYEDFETGLYYNYHRFYDTSLGSYVAADRLKYGIDVNHLYRYGNNNPIVNIDSFGLECKTLFQWRNGIGRDVSTNWQPLGYWHTANVIVFGPEPPLPFATVECWCERKRSGIKTTKTYKKWEMIKICYDGCGNGDIIFSTDKTLVNEEKECVYDTDRKRLAGGFTVHGDYTCAKLCNSLN